MIASQIKKDAALKPILKSKIKVYENTYRKYEIRKFLNFVNKKSINLSDIEEYLNYLKEKKNKDGKGLSTAAIHNSIYGLSAKLKRVLIQNNRIKDIGEFIYFIKSLPLGKYQSKSSFYVPTKQEMNRLIKLSPKNIALIIKTYYYTGCRFQELLNVQINDVKKINNEACLNILGKGRKPRVVFIPYKLFQDIKEEFKPVKFLFENSFKRQYKQRNLSKKIEKVGQRILNKKINLHSFRKAFATHIYKKIPRLKPLAEYLGNTPEILAKHYLQDQLTSKKIYNTLLTKEDKEKYL